MSIKKPLYFKDIPKTKWLTLKEIAIKKMLELLIKARKDK